MTKTRANLRTATGRDLFLDLTGACTRLGLERELREAVQTGRLAPGSRLPASRSLAVDLGIARNTVAEAFSQLVAEGWLEARVGAGTWVAGHPAAPPAPTASRRLARPVRFDLRPGTPDLALFPRALWGSALRRAVVAAPTEAFGNGDPRGRPELRAALAGYLARARGARVVPDQVVVTSGFTQTLDLLGAVLVDRNRPAIAVEGFGHASHRLTLSERGLALPCLPMDAQGADLRHLEGEGAVLLTPAHQFPLGMPLSARRRTQAVAWGRESAGLVVEDDYDGEFRYDRAALGAMQALAPDVVAFAGTSSKALAPGLRLGWVVLPNGWVDEVVAQKAVVDRFTGAVEQLALADLLESGEYDRHVRRCRLVYRARRDRLVAMLGRAASDVRVTGVAAGLHALVELPGRLDEQEVVAAARAKGVAVEGLSSFAAPGVVGPPALVVGYGTPPEHEFTTAAARLCAVLRP